MQLALIAIFTWAVIMTVFTLYILHVSKKHIRNLYARVSNVGEKARDAQAISIETAQEVAVIQLQKNSY